MPRPTCFSPPTLASLGFFSLPPSFPPRLTPMHLSQQACVLAPLYTAQGIGLLRRFALLHLPLANTGDHQQQLHLGRVPDCRALHGSLLRLTHAKLGIKARAVARQFAAQNQESTRTGRLAGWLAGWLADLVRFGLCR
jgi:hypothetical protein